MATRCTKCGTFLTDGERFCPNCGENAPSPAPDAQFSGASQAQGAPQSPQIPQPYPYNGQYNVPPPVQPVYRAPAEEEMSLGKWVGTVVVTTFFGLISLIFLFVWGFGSGPESRRRYCKAMLIVQAIALVLGMIIFTVFIAALIPAMNEFIEGFEEGYYGYFNEYGYNTSMLFCRLFN